MFYNKSYLWKGLPDINMALKRDQISNLNIITNDVHANVEKKDFKSISKSFSGTFVYWELNQDNISCHGINRN